MKKTYFILTLLFLVLLLVIPGAAEATLPRLVDRAELLTPAEYDTLLAELDEISERQKCDIVIVTEKSLNGVDSFAYADDLFDHAGFGLGESGSGILLLIDMDRREWTFSIAGEAMEIFPQSRQDAIIDRIIDDLADGAYSRAFGIYASLCDRYLSEGIPTYSPYHGDYDYDDRYEYEEGSSRIFSFGRLLLCLGVGVLGGFLYTSFLKAQLKSVAPASSAENYTKKDSFRLTGSSDVFLYRNVSRRPRQQNNSSGSGGVRMSSSGRSHSGSRGRF